MAINKYIYIYIYIYIHTHIYLQAYDSRIVCHTTQMYFFEDQLRQKIQELQKKQDLREIGLL